MFVQELEEWVPMRSRPCPDRFKVAVDYTSKSLISICTHINNEGFLPIRSEQPNPESAATEYLGNSPTVLGSRGAA